MKPGDVVEVEIEGIGVLRNRIVDEAAAGGEATDATSEEAILPGAVA
jgi:hypothetical protein